MPRYRASFNKNSARKEFYAQASVRVKIALSAEYYLEAIALIESLISDRLESYIEKETQQSDGFRDLGRNIRTAKRHANNSSITGVEELSACLEEIDNWRPIRNRLLHEAVKLEDGQPKSWNDMMAAAKQAAYDGEKLFRDLNNAVRKIKNNRQKRLSLTE